ncbi:hypothetical protein AeMF1_008156, partial [Aphanomyces euteiches]
GAATELASSTGGPPTVAVWLRAGWSLGAVANRYLFQLPGGDQYVGRAATGLSVNGVSFASLPPHFNEFVLTLDQWNAILPGFTSNYPTTFHCVVPNLLASLAFHYNWLGSNLDKKHPLFSALVWSSGLLRQLSGVVRTGVILDPVSKLEATGVPPNVYLLHEVRSLKLSMQEM